MDRSSDRDGSVDRWSDRGGSAGRWSDRDGSADRWSDRGDSVDRWSDRDGSVDRWSDRGGCVDRYQRRHCVRHRPALPDLLYSKLAGMSAEQLQRRGDSAHGFQLRRPGPGPKPAQQL